MKGEDELREKVRQFVFRCAGGIEGKPEVDYMMQLITARDAEREAAIRKRHEKGLGRLLKALLWQAGGSFTITKRSLVAAPFDTAELVMKDDIDGAVTLRLEAIKRKDGK